MPLALELGHAIGERLLDARERDAVELAGLSRIHERLGRKRATDDLAVGSQDVRAERLDQLPFHRVPQKHVVPHLVKIDMGKALVDERLARGRLAGAHAADDEQLLHACSTSSIMPPPSTVSPSYRTAYWPGAVVGCGVRIAIRTPCPFCGSMIHGVARLR